MLLGQGSGPLGTHSGEGVLVSWGGPESFVAVLALLKYPFYPLFNFDNGMNLISKSLTILTSADRKSVV